MFVEPSPTHPAVSRSRKVLVWEGSVAAQPPRRVISRGGCLLPVKPQCATFQILNGVHRRCVVASYATLDQWKTLDTRELHVPQVKLYRDADHRLTPRSADAQSNRDVVRAIAHAACGYMLVSCLDALEFESSFLVRERPCTMSSM